MSLFLRADSLMAAFSLTNSSLSFRVKQSGPERED